LQASAGKGNALAAAELEDLECPEELEYLASWAFQLAGRSGVGMDGPAPLSYSQVEAWSRLLDIEVEPHEVAALMELDAAIRNPDPPAEEKEAEAPRAPAWPTKKLET
jgi:hypothetical protein